MEIFSIKLLKKRIPGFYDPKFMLLLASNIKYLRKKNNGMTQAELGAAVGLSDNAISTYEKGKFFPTADVLVKICEYFNVSADDLLLKDLASGVETEVFESAQFEKGNNVLVPLSAQEEYVGKWSKKFIRELTYVNVPGVEGEARTFEVVENTMTPNLMPGEYVACVASSLSEIQSGRVYVIVSDRINIAYVQVEKDRVLCTPANRDEFEPYRIPNSAIREIWEAKAKVTDRITDPFAGGYNPKRLIDLEEFLKGKFPDLIVTE